MKLVSRAAIILLVVATASANAAPVCTPVPPAEWTASLQVLHQGVSSAVSLFETNGCKWGPMEQVNGTDGLVLDVEGHAGPADITLMVGDASVIHALTRGFFLDAGCRRMEGAFTARTGSDLQMTVNLLTIPQGAKWLAVDGTDQSFATNDLTVTVRAHGVDCPPIKKPRKKR